MNALGWLAVGLTLILSLVLPKVVKPWLAKAGRIDVPGERSSHVVPTVRGGGLAQWMGVAAGGFLAMLALPLEDGGFLLATVLAAALAIGLVGLVEDLRGLRVATRAGMQLVVGAGLGVASSVIVGHDWLWIPVVAVGFAAHVNFTNFMDGQGDQDRCDEGYGAQRDEGPLVFAEARR